MVGFITLLASLGTVARAQSSGYYRISGIAVNAPSGKPLNHATITLSTPRTDTLLQSVETGENGRFDFEHLAAGKYALRGSRRGFLAAGYDEHDGFFTAIVIGPSQNPESLVLRLTPGGVIAGTITDESGDPVRRAHVTLYRQSTETGIGDIQHMNDSITDDTGGYEFAHLQSGNYFLSVSAKPWYAISGETNPQGGSSTAHSALDVAYPVTYYAEATDPDSATPIPVKGGDHLDVSFALHAVPAIHLLIRVPEARGRSFSMPQLQGHTFGSEVVWPSATPHIIAPGLLELSGIPPGQYTLQTRGAGGADVSHIATLSETSDQEIDASVGDPLVSVSGTLQPAPGFTLPEGLAVILRRDGTQIGESQRIDHDGSFHFSGIAPGRVELLAQAPGTTLSITRLRATGATAEGHTLKVDRQPVSVTAMVIAGSTAVAGTAEFSGKPAPGAMVVLVPHDPAGNRDLFRRDQSDSDGSFLLTDVVPGAYTLVAIQNGWDLDWARPEVIGHYVPGGLAFSVPPRGGATLTLPSPVAVQHR
jgi:hypothetical protein